MEIILIILLIILLTSIVWVMGINSMLENHPEYKGEDFLRDDYDED